MLAIFDTVDDATRQLLRSLEVAGIPFTPLVIQYNGELPEGALSPFASYTGLELTGEPLFFDEVPIPRWCEIRQGRQSYAEVLRDGLLIGRIHYEANSFRQVERVDWLMPDGTLGHTDRYDRYGNRYATSYFTGGVAYQTVYRGPGEWEIEVDHATRIVTMRSPQRLVTFATLTDFVSHFISEQRLDDSSALINSLSHPLFVMRRRAARPNTTLFWQEPMPGLPPENMMVELEQPKALRRIVFADESLLEKVAAAYPGTALDLAYLSPLGQFVDKPDYDARRVFTLTNSDDLPWLAELLEAFPDVTFSVAALTLMSEKLHALGRRFRNLVLLPSATRRRVLEELEKASVYLDINAGAQVLDVVAAAYHLNLVVLASGQHAKAQDYECVLPTADELKEQLAAIVASPEGRARTLDRLHTQRGPLSTAEDYRRLLRPRGADDPRGGGTA